MDRIQSFGPVINQNSRIIILGSIPGIASLRENQYYAHPLNQFWRILYKLFDTPLDQNYSKKLTFLLVQKIALWDVVHSCYRAGSLDTNIQEEHMNDFVSLFKEYPNIHTIFFNGSKAYRLFRKEVGFMMGQVEDYELLPSTSPARTIPWEQKLKEWSKIKDLLSTF
jgi:hypoxanthine-DNA glycosylase